MKKLAFVFSLLFAGIFISHAQNDCDTLKLKTIATRYGYISGNDFNTFGFLDGAVINIDTLSLFYLGIDVVNVSNDTFYSSETFRVEAVCVAYADTGLIGYLSDEHTHYFGEALLPNDTMYAGIDIYIDLQYILDGLGVDVEQVSYWKLIIGVGSTSKDGMYSNSAFFAGTDTSIFHVVKTPVNIVETPLTASLQTVFPNPARSQFTVTNTQNASLHLYNMVGQEVLHTQSTDENTIINVSTLPQGLYVLKVVKNGAVRMYKVVVSG